MGGAAGMCAWGVGGVGDARLVRAGVFAPGVVEEALADCGNARILVARTGGKIKYVPGAFWADRPVLWLKT